MPLVLGVAFGPHATLVEVRDADDGGLVSTGRVHHAELGIERDGPHRVVAVADRGDHRAPASGRSAAIAVSGGHPGLVLLDGAGVVLRPMQPWDGARRRSGPAAPGPRRRALGAAAGRGARRRLGRDPPGLARAAPTPPPSPASAPCCSPTTGSPTGWRAGPSPTAGSASCTGLWSPQTGAWIGERPRAPRRRRPGRRVARAAPGGPRARRPGRLARRSRVRAARAARPSRRRAGHGRADGGGPGPRPAPRPHRRRPGRAHHRAGPARRADRRTPTGVRAEPGRRHRPPPRGGHGRRRRHARRRRWPSCSTCTSTDFGAAGPARRRPPTTLVLVPGVRRTDPARCSPASARRRPRRAGPRHVRGRRLRRPRRGRGRHRGRRALVRPRAAAPHRARPTRSTCTPQVLATLAGRPVVAHARLAGRRRRVRAGRRGARARRCPRRWPPRGISAPATAVDPEDDPDRDHRRALHAEEQDRQDRAWLAQMSQTGSAPRPARGAGARTRPTAPSRGTGSGAR